MLPLLFSVLFLLLLLLRFDTNHPHRKTRQELDNHFSSFLVAAADPKLHFSLFLGSLDPNFRTGRLFFAPYHSLISH